jgi:thioredoxin reductase
MNHHAPHPAHPVALESPATIAVLGGGPIGLEAALYGKFLGYEVVLFEQGSIGAHVDQWGHLPMLTPFRYLHSKLGRTAILTQQEDDRWPDDEAEITGHQWLQQYLRPLANTDLVAPTLRIGHRVVSVSRCRFRKQQRPPITERWQDGFELRWLDPQGDPQSDSFDFVLDATGTFQQQQPWGPGGSPAAGEHQLRAQWHEDSRLRNALHLVAPNIAAAPQEWADQRVLLIGDSLPAAQTAIALAQSLPRGRWLWALEQGGSAAGLYPELPDDPLPARGRLVQAANRLIVTHAGTALADLTRQAESAGTHIVTHTHMTAIQWDADRGVFRVGLRQWQPVDWEAVPDDFAEPDDQQGEWEFDKVVIAVGHRPDWELTRELIVPICAETECQASLRPALEATGDRLALQLTDPMWTMTPEGRYFVLGAKSFGRQPNYYYRVGLQQVRDAFRWIVGRANLDLETTLQSR